MPRYIDADALYKKLYPLDLADKRTYTINAKAVADAIANIPTADVVPKSEVEYWKKQCFYACMHNGCLDFAKIKAEVAREIFEEIERTLKSEIPFIGSAVVVMLANIKKKYTEGEDDRNSEG